MKYVRRLLLGFICMALNVVLCMGAEAIGRDVKTGSADSVKIGSSDSANPYQSVVERNVFGLKPPPPPAKGPDSDKPAPPKINLTGVTTILGNKRVLMTLTPPGKPGEQNKPKSLILTVGERQDDIEILDIDETIDGGTVKLNNHGTPQVLSMDKDSAKLTASAAPAMPGVPNPAGGFVPPPNAVGSPAANPGFKPIPTRTLRLPGTEHPAGSPGTSVNPPTPGFSSVQPQAQPVALHPDEQAMNMLVQHLQNTDKGIPMPPLPPPLAEAMEDPKQAQTAPAPTANNQVVLPRPGMPPLPQ